MPEAKSPVRRNAARKRKRQHKMNQANVRSTQLGDQEARAVVSSTVQVVHWPGDQFAHLTSCPVACKWHAACTALIPVIPVFDEPVLHEANLAALTHLQHQCWQVLHADY